jgi:hypothetical protein
MKKETFERLRKSLLKLSERKCPPEDGSCPDVENIAGCDLCWLYSIATGKGWKVHETRKTIIRAIESEFGVKIEDET